MTPADLVVSRLRETRRHDGRWSARCPAHRDRDPSLSVAEGDDGRALVLCRAGCRVEAIVAALGLTLADLFPESTRRGVRWLREYRYLDEHGRPLYRIRRGQSPNRDRRWSTDRPTPTGWESRYSGRRVLYRLPEMLANPDLMVWITEGERDADTLAEIGLVATTVANGSWRHVDLSPLDGRSVVVVVDNDEAGWRRGARACEAVVSAGARLLRVVRPLDGCKDVTCHIAEGQSVDLLMVVDLATDLPPIRSAPPPEYPVVNPATGLAYYVKWPHGVLLAHLQAERLEPADFAVFTLLEDRAGASGIAKVTASEVGQLIHRKRHLVGQSFARLAAVKLVTEIRRGVWHVDNPARRVEASARSLTYRNRLRESSRVDDDSDEVNDQPQPSRTLLPPRTPNKNPGSGPNPATRMSKRGHSHSHEWPEIDHSHSDDEALDQLRQAFPGTEIDGEAGS